jgi:hypothetical protein
MANKSELCVGNDNDCVFEAAFVAFSMGKGWRRPQKSALTEVTQPLQHCHGTAFEYYLVPTARGEDWSALQVPLASDWLEVLAGTDRGICPLCRFQIPHFFTSLFFPSLGSNIRSSERKSMTTGR